jgi:hypothetical protein
MIKMISLSTADEYFDKKRSCLYTMVWSFIHRMKLLKNEEHDKHKVSYLQLQMCPLPIQNRLLL